MMEEELLKILDKYEVDINYLGRQIAAKEIADHYRKFIEWIKNSDSYWFNPHLKKWGVYDKFCEFDEVYNYYRDNVLKK